MRRTLAILALAATIAACGGTSDGESDSTSPESGSSTITGSPPAESSTTISETPTTGDVCSLLGDGDLAVAFPDGVPDGVAGQGDQGQVSCTWGPVEANLTVTVWPGEEFYSTCETCEALDLGIEGSLDFSTFVSLALVRLDGRTVDVGAFGLGLDEQDFIVVVETAVDRSG